MNPLADRFVSGRSQVARTNGSPSLQGPVDVLSIDVGKLGHLDYLEKLLAPSGPVLARTSRRSTSETQYLHTISTNTRRKTLFLDQEAAGITVTQANAIRLQAPAQDPYQECQRERSP